jgi:tight adherence protein B
LVAFSDEAKLLTAPTADRQSLKNAIDGLQTGGNTALYDGVLTGLKVLGPTGLRRVVVLSDGGDTRSKATLNDVVRQATQSHVMVDAVAFRAEAGLQSTLGQLTSETGGDLYAATNTAGILTAFSSVVRSFITQVYIDVPVPSGLSRQTATVVVKAVTADGTLTDSTTFEVSGAVAPKTSSSAGTTSAATSTTVTSPRSTARTVARDIGLAALFVAFAIFGFLAIDSRFTYRKRELSEIVAAYGPAQNATARKTIIAQEKQARPAQAALQFTDRLLKANGWGQRLALRLDRAGLPIRANEWLVLQIGSVVALTALLVVLGANLIIAVLVCCAAVAVVPHLWLSYRINKRRADFLAQLPDALQVLAGSLATGYSLDQALDALLVDAPEPLAGELGRAASEARLAVPLDTALSDSAQRMQLEEFDWAVMAIQVQRTVGGSLAEVLRNVASTIRKRAALRRQVRVLSAEGRISAYILIALPLFMVTFFLLFKPQYFHPMYTSPGGVMALFVGAVFMVVGWFWMRKLVKVDV